MGRAIKYMCSHCGQTVYFNKYMSLGELTTLECYECGRNHAVLALDVDAPPDMPVLNQIPLQWSAHARSGDGPAY
jgi:DNA-directed RNA polymerase subunit RPC12/RpoP